jgi:hypothetical protein
VNQLGAVKTNRYCHRLSPSAATVENDCPSKNKLLQWCRTSILRKYRKKTVGAHEIPTVKPVSEITVYRSKKSHGWERQRSRATAQVLDRVTQHNDNLFSAPRPAPGNHALSQVLPSFLGVPLPAPGSVATPPSLLPDLLGSGSVGSL